jgi:hypothetical protein
LQGTQFPLIAVKPLEQDVTHLPLAVTPDRQVQTPETGDEPAGQVCWQTPWKK